MSHSSTPDPRPTDVFGFSAGRTAAVAAATLLGALFAWGPAIAQTDTLYLSDGDGDRILVVSGSAIVNEFPAVPAVRAFPIAVKDLVRTTGYSPGETGGEYSLDGDPTGTTFTLAEGASMSDGTTDGEFFNYGISFTGNVFRYDRSWANGVLLFTAASHAGITYDFTDGTLWLSRDRAPGISHYTRDGVLLGSFATVPDLDWLMALEPSTGALWVSDRLSASLSSYDKAGTFLGTIPVPSMTGSTFLSGEFPVVPLPPLGLLYFEENGNAIDPRGLYDFQLSNKASVLRTTVTGADRFFGMATRPSDGAVFAIDVSGVLYTMDPDTGVFQLVGPTSQPVLDIAFQPRTGQLFGIGNAATLVTIDDTSGAATVVGPSPGITRALAFAPNGDLFGTTDSGTLHEIDPSDGTPTLVGATGILSQAEGGVITAGGRMFVADFTGALYEIDLETGDNTFLGSTTMGSGTLGLTVVDTESPTGSLADASGEVGQDITVNADLTDNLGIARAILFYRAGGSGSFSSDVMTETSSGSGTYRGRIEGEAVGLEGVQYYVEVSDGFDPNTITLPDGAPDSELESASVALQDHVAFTLEGGRFALAGLSMSAADAGPEAVFDEFGAYDPVVWRYGTYDPASEQYREPPAAAMARPGQGFWIITRDGGEVAVSGTSSDLSDNLSITLQAGWNQIANPFAFPVDVNDVLPSAARNFVAWDGTGYVAGQTVLQPFTGYWIENTGTAPQTIQIPPRGVGQTREASAPGLLATDEPGWSAEIQAWAGEYHDLQNRFGIRPDATDGRDAFDFSDAPSPPAGYVSVSLLDGNGKPMLTDFRPEGDGAQWTVRLQSDQAGEPFRIEFVNERELPEGWELWAFEGTRGIDLQENRVIRGTVAGLRTWTVSAGTPAFLQSVQEGLEAGITAFSFSRPYPNPARETSFHFAVPRRVEATVQVFDVRGRLVRELMHGAIERGAHQVRWDGTDSGGSRVSSGVYFVRVNADDFTVSRKVVLLR